MKKHMVKRLFILPLFVSMVSLAACQSDGILSSNSDEADLPDALADAQAVVNGITGNGAPSGAHYNLNIIGVPKDKTADMTGNNGHRIFVKLEGKSKISLSPGEEYAVLDANGTDGPAAFQLPNPDPDGDGMTEYSIFARALGKPGGSSTISLCASAEDETTGELVDYCSTLSTIAVREKGKTSFSEVTKSLLTITIDLDGDGVTETYSLFDDALEGYFWDYDNNGLKLYQMRFYEVPSDISTEG